MTDARSDDALAQSLRDQGIEVEQVRDILEQTDGGNPHPGENRIGSFVLACREDYPTSPFPAGIYFGLPEDVYHSVPALSSHGIKDLAASPMVYWDRCRWLNPDWEDREEKAHLTLGKAYECRILEGEAAFYERFAAAADKRDYPDALVTLKDIEARLDGLGLKAPRSKEAAFEKLRDFEPDAQLWDQILAEHVEAMKGKTMLPAADIRRIEIANRLVQLSEDQAAVVNQGHAQVSLFWECSKTGVPMKMRADKLLIRAIIDAKTIGNIDGSFEAWIPRTIANYKYNLQPSVYLEGAEEVRKLVRERGADVIFGCEGVDDDGKATIGRADPNTTAWAEKWAANRAPDEWLWLFLQTKPPITRLVHYPRGGTTKMVTDEIVSRMKKRFRLMCETYGADAWLDLAPRIDLADEDIPRWSTEI